MLHHRVIKIGNSVGITLPKRFIKSAGIEVGDMILIEVSAEYKTIFIKPKNQTYNPFLTPIFFKWARKYLYRKRI